MKMNYKRSTFILTEFLSTLEVRRIKLCFGFGTRVGRPGRSIYALHPIVKHLHFLATWDPSFPSSSLSATVTD